MNRLLSLTGARPGASRPAVAVHTASHRPERSAPALNVGRIPPRSRRPPRPGPPGPGGRRRGAFRRQPPRGGRRPVGTIVRMASSHPGAARASRRRPHAHGAVRRRICAGPRGRSTYPSRGWQAPLSRPFPIRDAPRHHGGISRDDALQRVADQTHPAFFRP